MFKSKNSKRLLTVWGLIFIILILITGGLFYISNSSLSTSIANVETERDNSMVLMKNSSEVANKLSDKAASLMSNPNISYNDANSIYNDIENIVNQGKKIDQDFVSNAEKQKKVFQPKIQFLMSSDKKDKIAEIKKSLSTEYDNSVSSKNNTEAEAYAMQPLVRSIVDMVAAGEALQSSDIKDALTKAAPLQRYTRPGFAFDNESLVKSSNPSAYDAMQNSKKLFADTYNYFLAVNAGNYQEANNLFSGLSNRYEVTMASISNSINEKNKLSENFYQSEITAIEQYIVALDNLRISYNKGREAAYYTLQNVEYYNFRENKYPRVSDFNALKQTLNLEYGSADLVKYSSSADDEYIIEYLNNNKDWYKIEIKSTGTEQKPTQSV